VTLSGLPSIAMAYLGEEIDPRSLGRAMGLLIGGSAFGGMMGRTLTGALTDLGSWRLALGTIGLLSLAGAVAFRRSLPESRHFVPRRVSLAAQSAALSGHFAEPGLPWLFAMGFLLMGSFVTLYNYIGYRLTAPPYDLSQTVVGLLFSVYLVGIFASTGVGGLADRLGRRRMLWVAVTLFLIGVELSRAASLPVIMLGIATATFGFFGAHAIASSWVSRRALTAKAQAASLYLCAYYLGSSVIGWLGGLAWASFGWNGVIDMETVLLAVGLLISFRLGRLKPLSPRS
jgi:YNFM family putative membrane transporter